MFARTGWLFCFLISVPGWAQSTPAAEANNAIVSNGSLLHTLLSQPVVGHPYSAVQVHSTQRVLADGTNIAHQGHHLVARDAEGRVHVEMRLANGRDGQPDPAMIFVRDPIAHTLTTWVVGPNSDRQAVVYPLPVSAQAPAASGPVDSKAGSKRPQPIITVQDLGTDTMDGVPVSMQLTTTVVPVGRSGNDAPITKTDEKWISADMQLILREQWKDPRTGMRTVELTNLSTTNPDPAMFRPPSGYAIKSARESLRELEDKLGDSAQ